MTEQRARPRGMGLLIAFLLGGAGGYWFRNQQADREVREAAAQARAQVEETALEAIDRARRAGSDLAGGAEAAAESTRAAFKELTGSERP